MTCMLPLDVSVLQQPVLPVDVSVRHRPVLQPELTGCVFPSAQHVLSLDKSDLRAAYAATENVYTLCFLWMCLSYSSLCCLWMICSKAVFAAWMNLFYRGMCCSWPYLLSAVCAVSGCVCLSVRSTAVYCPKRDG
jgi:hypothetical protein